MFDQPLPPEFSRYVPDVLESHAQMVARALGKLHSDEILWQDPRGRMCVRGSAFAAKPPLSGGRT